LRRHLRADGIEVVHAWLYFANSYAWMANLGVHRSLITSARNCKVHDRMTRLVNRLAFRASRAIVVNSRDVRAYIARQYGAPGDRIRVVYNAIDTQRFVPGDGAGTGANGSGPQRALGPIVTVGRLVRQKNHELFLRAAARLSQDVSEARFIVVGDGPLRPALQQQACNLGIAERVTFTGERPDVDRILHGASLFWLTSRWEGLPNVVLEAMASGVPAIVTDVGGTRELVRCGVDGFVVPSGEVDAFVRHSRELLREANRRREFGRAARARAEEFSSARMVRALSDVYEEVLTCRR
jgi:glycosyltransferase involved in cell wall biosynthesis